MENINCKYIVDGKLFERSIPLENFICEAYFNAICICNAEYKATIQRMFTEFNSLKRIRKIDMERILSKYLEIELGEDINSSFQDAE